MGGSGPKYRPDRRDARMIGKDATVSSDDDDSGSASFLRWLLDYDDWRWNSGHAFISVILTVSAIESKSAFTAALSVVSWLWLLRRYWKSSQKPA